MKRILALFLVVCTLLFAGCSRYINSVTAFGFYHATHKNGGEMSFARLKGRYVFKLKANIESGEGCIAYSVEVTEGDGLTISYDSLGVKEILVEVNGCDSVTGRGGYIEKGNTIYVIVETKGEGFIQGNFSFEFTSQPV